MEESSESLLDRESAFHDHVFAEEARARAAPFYAVVRPSKRYYAGLALDGCDGLTVLEYGCGRGGLTFQLADGGAQVFGIDISTEAVRHASKRADSLGLSSACFSLMDGHSLAFPDDSIDRVCGSGILHHLDLDTASSEIARVLKPGGDAVFFEPLGHNPLIEWYRRRTPELRSPDEHPLLVDDLSMLEERFTAVDTRFFHMASLAAVPLRKTAAFGRVAGALERFDQGLFALIPWLSRLAWIVVIRLKT